MTTRDDILDGAMHVMSTRGLARATTKEIARAAGYSEATLYRLFVDKVDLFLCVLAERLPRIGLVSEGVAGRAGIGTVAANLEQVAVEMTRFYAVSFPIAMSLFSDPDLLARHRDAVRVRGAGPEVVLDAVAEYLRSEQQLGRIAPDAPIDGVADALVGACFQRAFLLRFSDLGRGTEHDPDPEDGFAARLVAAVLPALVIRPAA